MIDRICIHGAVLSFICMAVIAVCDVGVEAIDRKAQSDFNIASSISAPVMLWKAANHCQDWDCVYLAYEKGWKP